MCLKSPRYIKEVEDKIRDSLLEEIIREAIGPLVEIVMKVIEDMAMVEVNFREEIFKEEVIFEVDIIIEQIEVGKIEDYGDNLGQEKEEVGCHLVLDQDLELVLIEIGLGVLNVENMTILQMNVLI